ncbi:DUF4167 domain-containing protein [Sphingosinicellaceae bacterium A1X5R2]|nr:DUF4167 domain-containing protein [Pedomonas mirosovicensis]MCH8686156.1 DUF4167 domain-containing protein [Pedomonas mirosovicensis]
MEAGNRNDARIRGNAQQLLEKYKSLARDATASGDRILAEYYMQHADHYYRVLAEFRSRYDDAPRSRDRDDRDTDEGGYDEDVTETTAPQAAYVSPSVQHSLGLEPAAPEAPSETRAEPVAEAAGAEEAGAAPAEGEEAPRRRRRGRPRKVKPEEGVETADTAENAA